MTQSCRKTALTWHHPRCCTKDELSKNCQLTHSLIYIVVNRLPESSSRNNVHFAVNRNTSAITIVLSIVIIILIIIPSDNKTETVCFLFTCTVGIFNISFALIVWIKCSIFQYFFKSLITGHHTKNFPSYNPLPPISASVWGRHLTSIRPLHFYNPL